PWPLAFLIRKTVYPRDVREAVWRLENHKKQGKGREDSLFVLLAHHLSKGARLELKLRGIAFFDLQGALYIKHRRWLISLDAAPPPKETKTHGIDLFTGARESVVHAVLQTRGEWFNGIEIVESSRTSGYSVSLVLQELENLEWVQSQGRGRHRLRRLIAPGRLLDAWSCAWKENRKQNSRWYLFCQNPQMLLEELSLKVVELDIKCTFTGAIVANRLSPLLTEVSTAEMIIYSSATEVAECLGLKPAEKGSNVVLSERSGASELFQEYSAATGTWSSSPFIQYLDLLDGRGRNAELAKQFRSDILKI
ncbi:type IV toxin-antitoxin system AbiEi family antitoxin, partial [Pseudomonas aeruginosa]